MNACFAADRLLLRVRNAIEVAAPALASGRAVWHYPPLLGPVA
jgi:hypothetical protein